MTARINTMGEKKPAEKKGSEKKAKVRDNKEKRTKTPRTTPDSKITQENKGMKKILIPIIAIIAAIAVCFVLGLTGFLVIHHLDGFFPTSFQRAVSLTRRQQGFYIARMEEISGLRQFRRSP